MERMLKRIAVRKDGTISMSEFKNFAEKYQGEINELEEENKKLNEEIQRFKDNAMQDMREITELEIENKKLNERIKELEQCNLNLQEWLDNKEKVNKSLREENEKLKKYYDRDKEELMESCYSLAKENEKLKSDLEECECSFGFENDEVGYRKRERKKLKDRIDVLYEFIERNDKLVDEVIAEEDLDKLNRYIYIDDDLVDRTLESED